MKIELFYDKECPFCNSYSNYIKLKEKHTLILINARESIKELEKFKVQGFDINNGFIIRVDKEKLYQGVNAIVFINAIAKKRIYFPNNSFFRFLVYSIIKIFRKIVLFFLRKKNNLL